jgi:hypothetical protein
MIGVFVGFRAYLLGILIFEGLIARRRYMSFGMRRLTIYTYTYSAKLLIVATSLDIPLLFL